MKNQQNKEIIAMVSPKEKVAFDGERCTPWVKAPTFSEHVHRYISVIPYCKGKDVLDIASGEGYGSAILANNGAKTVVGADVSDDAVSRANRVYGSSQLSYCLADATKKLPFDDDSFDVIICFETIEHIQSHEYFVNELTRVLKTDGLLIMSTPDKDHPASQNSTNQFHEKELTETEFVDLLSSHFTHIQKRYQRFFVGSMIVDEDQTFGNKEVFVERQNFTEFSKAPTPSLLRYIILFASNFESPVAETGILHDRKLSEVLIQAGREFGVD